MEHAHLKLKFLGRNCAHKTFRILLEHNHLSLMISTLVSSGDSISAIHAISKRTLTVVLCASRHFQGCDRETDPLYNDKSTRKLYISCVPSVPSSSISSFHIICSSGVTFLTQPLEYGLAIGSTYLRASRGCTAIGNNACRFPAHGGNLQASPKGL